MEFDMCDSEIICRKRLVSNFEIKRDVVGNELIVGALNPVDFERSRDTISGKIL